ncbi:hypothetical protein Drose_08955 [Dactylosporangium roseum]|uniref:Uncharacterized protein n=1 Tax=Dactylosporangium roseum TaxID=47989 RepID=A0ABY5ZDF3_9ACTN|nr:hypothetical protein [Dactylosporangium roseum]UWZ38354.1 hypothetical protein Drose_08955 [Dactylosporangium roseum]
MGIRGRSHGCGCAVGSSWGVSAALLLGIGAVGISVNRSALRAAETVHRADTLALTTNNGGLAEQLLLVSAKELSDFAIGHPLSLTRGLRISRSGRRGCA